MCQSNVYLSLSSGGREELILEDVGLIRPEGNGVLLESIFGERLFVEATIKEIDLIAHKVILEKR